jgi:hypothetical protein
MNENESKDMVKIENATRFEIVELDDMDLDAAAGGVLMAPIEVNVPCGTTNTCTINTVAGCGA